MSQDGKKVNFIEGNIKTKPVYNEDDVKNIISNTSGQNITYSDELDESIEKDKSPNQQKWFIHELRDVITQLPGCREREQILFYLNACKPLKVSKKITTLISDNIRNESKLINLFNNLDGLQWPKQSLWFEMEDFKNIGNQSISTIGYLIIPNQDIANSMIGMVAWKDSEGRIFHSFSVLHWNKDEIENRIKTNEDIVKQLNNLTTPSIPEGFMTELEIMNGIESFNDPIIEKVTQENILILLNENIFILYLMLLLSSKNCIIETENDNDEINDMYTKWKIDLPNYSKFAKFFLHKIYKKDFSIKNNNLYFFE